MTSDYLLGKKIEAAPKPEAEDEYEYFLGQHGDRLMRNKRTKAIESAKPRRINVTPPPPIYTTEQWDKLVETLMQQEDDGLPLNEFGVM